jgi:hypothetical protein
VCRFEEFASTPVGIVSIGDAAAIALAGMGWDGSQMAAPSPSPDTCRNLVLVIRRRPCTIQLRVG